MLNSTLAAYAGPLGPYQNGVWGGQNTTCWSCYNGGPASAAATLYALTGQSRPDLLQEAEQTIDTAISTRQGADGSFRPPPNTGDGQPPDVATMFFGVEFGTVYHELTGVLDPARRLRWQASLSAAANYLIHNGNVTWYTNGNINLGNVEFFYLVWQATGNAAYQQAYETSWNTALSPDQTRFPKMGLVLVKAPAHADGSDGSGYLTEKGVGGVGFDPEYTELQLDCVSRLYLLSRDARALRISNLLLNMLLPRVDSTWRLDTSGGTRVPDQGRKVGFMTSALAVLADYGGRGDLNAMVLPELREEEAYFAQSSQAYNPFMRRALGNDVAVIALAAGNYSPSVGASPTSASPATGSATPSPPVSAPVSVKPGQAAVKPAHDKATHQSARRSSPKAKHSAPGDQARRPSISAPGDQARRPRRCPPSIGLGSIKSPARRGRRTRSARAAN